MDNFISKWRQFMEWGKILAIVGVVFLLWYTFRVLKAKPELFTTENFNKSMVTFGVLALALVGFISLCVFLLKLSA
jgi:arginine exporter protein ArgO